MAMEACQPRLVEGSLEVKLPTIWTDEKQSREEAEIRERLEERRSEKRKSQKKEDADARKGRLRSRRNTRLVLAAGAEPAGHLRDEKLHAVEASKHMCRPKSYYTQAGAEPAFGQMRWSKNCMPLWREAHVQAKMYKTQGVRTTFGSWDVEKVHAKHTSKSKRTKHHMFAPLLEFRCRKSARRCGAKHISKSKC